MANIVSPPSPDINEARDRLTSHPLYANLDTCERVQIFMKHHVFAVWDFFSLLKRLQNEVTCTSVPWMPRGLGDHARFITEILVAEECDEGLDGHHLSHFELYLIAMEEMQADRAPIEDLIAHLSARPQDPVATVVNLDIPSTVREFVSTTLRVAVHGEPHEVAASFCHGRENLLPDVFTAAHGGMDEVLDQAPVFKHYLERHIALDHDEHGPLALRLLDVMCDGHPTRIDEANRAAVEAITAREGLWDGVLAEIDKRT